MIPQLPQILFKVVFLFKTFTGNFNVYHIIGQETPPLKPSGKMLKKKLNMWAAVVSQIETHTGGRKGREREIHLAHLHPYKSLLPAVQLLPCSKSGEAAECFCKELRGNFLRNPHLFTLETHPGFFIWFSPLLKEVGKTLNTNLCSSKPRLRLQDLLPAWLWLSMEEEVRVCRASNSHVPQGGIKITQILNGL